MQTMGQRFKAAREKKRVSLSQAALKTRIKIQHLEAMERDDFSKMPAPIYARGFIRNYCEFLGLDPAPMLLEYNEQHGGARRPSIPVDAKIIKNVPGDQPLPTAMGGGDLPESERGRPEAAASPPGSSGPRFDLRALAVGGAIIGAILLVVAAVKFWPARRPGDAASRVVEVGRPVAKSPMAVMREPPEPYIELPAPGARAP